MLIDTHAHLVAEQFDSDRDTVIERAVEAGVELMISVATTVESSQRCIELAAKHPAIRASVGIHPNNAAEAGADDWSRIVELSASPQVVALGETGLDRHWDNTPFPMQQDYFDRHLRLSQQTGLPAVIHLRECDADMLIMLREARRRGPLAAVMHSFAGAAETAAECIELGLFISFAGMVTFKKSDALRAIAQSIPDDRLLVETDCPYLSPDPLRGKRNEPSRVVHTARCIAQARGVSFEQLAELTTRNAKRLFRLQ